MKKLLLIEALCVIAVAVTAQSFRIVSKLPARQVIVPGVSTGSVVGVCVSTPVVPAHYEVDVSTDFRHWETRLGVDENNPGTNCWIVPLKTSETNRFFLRAVRR